MPTGVTGALTLQQWAQQANDPLVQRVVFSLLEVHSVVNDLRFRTMNSLKANGSRVVDSLPTVNWRKLNEATVVTSGTAAPFQESAYVISNAFDVDRLLLADKNAIGNPMTVQLDMYMKSVSYDFTDKFINNNHAAGDSDGFVGIRSRLDDTVWGNNTACKIDCGGVDMSDAGLSSANGNKFIRFMQQTLDVMGFPEGDGVVFYMNRDLKRRLEQGIRMMGSGGGFGMVKDAFDRQLLTYRNAIIRAIGVKGDQSTEIITSTETNAGANGSSSYTSFYAVKYGETTFDGWQFEEPLIQFIGQRQEEPTHVRVFFEWALGFYQQYTRAIARGYDVKVS